MWRHPQNQKYITYRNVAINNTHKNLVMFGHVVFELCVWTDKQTNKQTDILITILRTPFRDEEIRYIYGIKYKTMQWLSTTIKVQASFRYCGSINGYEKKLTTCTTFQSNLITNYIRQVNGVKLADILFSLLSVCLSVCLYALSPVFNSVICSEGDNSSSRHNTGPSAILDRNLAALSFLFIARIYPV